MAAHAPHDADDLDTRIRAAELRLIEREENLRRRYAAFGARLHAATRPKRWIGPAIGALVAGVALWWVLRTLRRPAAVVAAHAGRGAVPAMPAHEHAGVPWVGLLGLLWPLLPAHWRNRVSPATATTVMTVGLPLVQKLFSGHHDEADVAPATVAQVDLARYAGTWHEIARLPAPFEAACTGQPTATYLPHRSPEGGFVEVINRCPTAQGVKLARGVARVVPGGGGARLEVSFWPAWLRWLPLAWAPYWILHLDPGYQEALVGHPNRRWLWLLARTPTLPEARLRALLQIARGQGFAVDRLRFPPPR